MYQKYKISKVYKPVETPIQFKTEWFQIKKAPKRGLKIYRFKSFLFHNQLLNNYLFFTYDLHKIYAFRKRTYVNLLRLVEGF